MARESCPCRPLCPTIVRRFGCNNGCSRLYFSLTWDTQIVGPGWAGGANLLAAKPKQATARPNDEPLLPAFGEVARGQQLSRNGLAAGRVWRGAMVNFSMSTGNLVLPCRHDIPWVGSQGAPS